MSDELITASSIADLTDKFNIAEGVVDISRIVIWGLADLEKFGLERVKFGDVIYYQGSYLQCRNRKTIHDENGIRVVLDFAPFEPPFHPMSVM